MKARQKETDKLATIAQDEMSEAIKKYFVKCVKDHDLDSGTLVVTAELTRKNGNADIKITTKTKNRFRTGFNSN